VRKRDSEPSARRIRGEEKRGNNEGKRQMDYFKYAGNKGF
jgi:hypothetical protein